MTVDCSHCLRPTFTRNLVHTLLERGTSVNLIGPPGSGRRRLLEDIRQADLPNAQVLLVDLRSHKESYAGFLRSLWRQLEQREARPPQDLGKVVTQLENSEKRIIMLLDNFDALLDNPDIDPKFDVRFFDHLNSLKNHPRMALVCVTAKPHDQSIVITDGKPHGSSGLDLEKSRLPALSREEIRTEIERRQPGLESAARALIIEAIDEPEQAYRLLDEMLRKLANGEDTELSLQERLLKWKGQLQSSGGYIHTGVLFRFLRKLRAWAVATGITRLKAPFTLIGTLFRLIQKWIGGGSNKP